MKNNQILLSQKNEKSVIFRHLVKEIPSTTHAAFALYKYPAKFIPQVIAYCLKNYSQPGESVFDPFAGYGTVGTVAKIYGNHYELWDLNPLLKYYHAVAMTEHFKFDVSELVLTMKYFRSDFKPNWSNINYWFPEEFLPMISRAWGFYHSLDGNEKKIILLIPLIKATRYFSFNDEKRQKLSRSSVANKRVEKLLAKDWEDTFFRMVHSGILNIQKRLNEYRFLKPKPVNAIIKAGFDTFNMILESEHDVLITSPPYLQAQEYIRAAKMDLYWLGFSDAEVSELGKKEIPYRDIPEFKIQSPTFFEYLEQIEEENLRRLYKRYFFGVLGSLTRLQEKIRHHLLLFVGPATIRSNAIPIDKIFLEHFLALGWKHEITLIDSIVSRSMFFYGKNPATNRPDNRMTTEHLVVLSRR
jgi:DNA modification methylase